MERTDEELRQRVVRELHSNMLAPLLRVNFQVAGLASTLDPTQRPYLTQILADLDEVVAVGRALAVGLQYPEPEPTDVRRALQTIANAGANALHAPSSVEIDGPVDGLAAPLSWHLCAAAQELVTNVVQHSGASRFCLRVSVTSVVAELSVEDDGIGSELPFQYGLGLANLAARARDLGGRLSVASAAQRGTQVRWHVPRTPPPQSSRPADGLVGKAPPTNPRGGLPRAGTPPTLEMATIHP